MSISAGNAASDASVLDHSLNDISVLIVEDTTCALKLLSGLLSDAGYSSKAQASLKLADQVIESVFEGVLIINQHGAIEWVNPSFTKISGYEPCDVVVIRADAFIVEQDKHHILNLLKPNAEDSGLWVGELKLKLKHKLGHELICSHLKDY